MSVKKVPIHPIFYPKGTVRPVLPNESRFYFATPQQLKKSSFKLNITQHYFNTYFTLFRKIHSIKMFR